jgi:transposase
MCPLSYYEIMRESKDKRQIRWRLVQAVEKFGIKAAARMFSVSRNTARKWYRRYQEGGYAALEDISRKPDRSPRATPDDLQKKLVGLKVEKYKRIGAEAVRLLEDIKVSPKTIRKIWRKAGINSKRRRKHETKRCLREEKKRWRLFQQIDEDTKDLVDIPEYWRQMRGRNLPKVQYTARDVTSGLTYRGYADERSIAYATLFTEYVSVKLQEAKADLSRTRRQSDNGSEYVGSWQKRGPSAYTLKVESVKGQHHQTIPPGAHRWQADVETVHNLDEKDFYELEQFVDRKDFLEKAYSYQLFFNLERPNTGKENQTPWQIAREKEPGLSIQAAMIPPVFLDELFEKGFDSTVGVGHDVCSVP